MNNPVSIELAAQRFELRPEFARLVELEKYFEKPLLEIADMFMSGEARLALIVETLAIILNWPNASRAALGEEIVAAGVGKTLLALQGYFAAALGVESAPGPSSKF